MGLLEWMHVYPQLPVRMASHFDPYGRPNGSLPKETFFLVMAFAVVMTGAIGFLLPIAVAAAPAELINLPRKDYWLGPERREETLRFLRARLEWFACGVLFVLLYATSQAINANLPDNGPSGPRECSMFCWGFCLSPQPAPFNCSGISPARPRETAQLQSDAKEPHALPRVTPSSSHKRPSYVLEHNARLAPGVFRRFRFRYFVL